MLTDWSESNFLTSSVWGQLNVPRRLLRQLIGVGENLPYLLANFPHLKRCSELTVEILRVRA